MGRRYGVFVLDPCDKFLETACNGDISDSQRSYVSAVTPFHDSEHRGLQLADDIESYMATSGATYVNIVGHSQGGLDARKAAAVLAARKGRRVVNTLISVSSPHRGSPVALEVLRDFGGTIAETLANYYGSVVYRAGHDAIAAMKQLIFDDADPNDGAITGAAAFNLRYPVNANHVARYRSLMTAQNGLDVNPAFWLLSAIGYDIDGDGYCAGDGDGDGAWGCGDGTRGDRDDDGLVGIDSQQMDYRLEYVEEFANLDEIYDRTDHGYVGDLNAPTPQQATSLAYVIAQDHIDVIGVGPDTFDEMEFYAAITVQAKLAMASPEERAEALRLIREQAGMDEGALRRWEELDATRDSRWAAGAAYMEDRQRLAEILEGDALAQALAELRARHFGAEAELIAAEEEAGVFRFEMPREYGRN